MNRRLLIPLGAGVLVVLLWFVALWGPQGSALSSAKKRRNDAEAQGATLRDQLTRLQQARRDQPLKQSQVETLRVAIPDDPNLAQFILDANDAASRSGIDFLSITPSLPTASSAGPGSTVPGGGSATPIPIRIGMTVAGGYFQVLDFVNRLDTLPRIVVVDTLAINSGAATTQLQVTLGERIFTTSAASASTGATTTTTINPAVTTTTRSGGA